MADPAVAEQIAALLDRAEGAARAEGYAQAERDYFGTNVAGVLANIYADAMEAAAGRLGAQLGAYAAIFRRFAQALRDAVDPPQIASVEPQDGATAVPADQVVSATYGAALEPTTALSALTVAPASGGPALAGAGAYDPATDTVSFTPARGLTAGVEYKASVEGAHSPYGIPAEARDWTFTVADA